MKRDEVEIFAYDGSKPVRVSAQTDDGNVPLSGVALQVIGSIYGSDGSVLRRIYARVPDIDNLAANQYHLATLAALYGFDGTAWDRLRTYGTGILKVGRTSVGLSNSGVLSADTQVKASAGVVHWLTVSDTADLLIELNDSVGGAGTDLWALILPSDGYAHFIFDPPIEFGTGIYLDVSTATCKVVLGYI